ncbi:hypothetical protein ZWY2020_018647 [Hordeum vulgare]|nr:hypothetical protein ZWY2020_018647 [Hordeum vulgare]
MLRRSVAAEALDARGDLVLDASNCQGCAAQFSLFTRKHHCQRCGGLFCSSCTQQRMVLRGQGDSPVRICDPCKKLEEAARYELRYGHKNRAGKASTKTASKPEDEILSELLGGDSVHGQLSRRNLWVLRLLENENCSTAYASSSGSRKASVDGNGDGSLSTEAQNYELNTASIHFISEELRQQAVEEKGKYKILKSEGKPEEALRAFKHGKELERQLKKAKILERQLEEQEILGEAEESDDDLAAIIHNMDDDNQDDILYDNSRLPAINFEQILAVSDDLNFDGNFDVTDEDINDPAMAAALKSFGWSEDGDNQMDSHAPVSSLNREAVKEQVLALKREAVSHKKAGNVAEAMSLLKKAKLLEKDLETEQPESEVLFPGQKITHTEDIRVTEINTRRVSAIKSKLKALALRREGKVDEAEEELKKGSILEKQLEELESSSNRSVARENMGFSSKSPLNAEPPSLDFADERSSIAVCVEKYGWEDDDNDSVKTTDKPLNRLPIVAQKPKKNKGQIQKELLAIKRKALAFRREGKNTEAEEELEKAKVLEEQLAEIEELANSTASQKGSGPHVPNVHATASSIKHALKEDVLLPVNASELRPIDTVASSGSKPQTETVISQPTHNSKVTSDGAYSLHSPSDVDHKEPPSHMEAYTLRDDILSIREKHPQQDIEDGAHELTTSVVQQSNSIQQSASISTHTSPLTYAPPAQENKSVEPQKAMSSRDRLRIQRESLTHKRNALKLRREGKTAEADADFELAKSLESQLEESDSQGSNSGGKSTEASDAFVEDLIDPQMMSALKSIGWSAADLSTQSPSLQPPVKAEARPTAGYKQGSD